MLNAAVVSDGKPPHPRELTRKSSALHFVRNIGQDNPAVVFILGAIIATGALLTACSHSAGSASRTAASPDFATRVDIGDGRKIFIECRGIGGPTVVLVSGLDAAADLWHRPEQRDPTVFTDVAKFTRVCAYDRPGTPLGAGLPSRSDPVAQPTTPKNGVDDLHAVLRTAQVPGPYVLVGHSYGGLVTRLFASAYPSEVSGMVLVDILSDGLREAMMPEEWAIWKKANARLPQDIAQYPALERTDYEVALDQIKAAPPIRPMPLVVLSADALYASTVPVLIDKGDIPPDTPRDFGYVIDRANKAAQNALAQLVPGVRHVTNTHSGHNMMIDQPQLVIDAIYRVVAAVRRGEREVADCHRGGEDAPPDIPRAYLAVFGALLRARRAHWPRAPAFRRRDRSGE